MGAPDIWRKGLHILMNKFAPNQCKIMQNPHLQNGTVPHTIAPETKQSQTPWGHYRVEPPNHAKELKKARN